VFLDLGGLFVSPFRPSSGRPVAIATVIADNARSGGAVKRQISRDLSKRQISRDLSKRLVGLP
jgi:hypothetical protein